ncbi:MAG: YebC/PmpR family DNA-binding transcriptional regulator [Patescibacteria group bacterium]|nr:YebC/PmpR family DNA-binding transcriptional regulator [Patescibacteria group bacterium]
MGGRKWHEIKDKKAAQDASKGKLFTQFSRNITMAARQGGGDIETNNTLRVAVDIAKKQSMSKDAIDRAIKKGTGEGSKGVAMSELQYEAYGPGGAAILINVLTDNSNRSVNHIRLVLMKNEGRLADSGSVAWMFERKGVIIVQAGEGQSTDDIELLSIDAGAEDVVSESGSVEITSSPDIFFEIESQLKESGYSVEYASVDWIPNQEVDLQGEERTHTEKLIDLLDEIDDVVDVTSNLK